MAEVTERRPPRFADGLGRWAAAPWGAIVDGYQLIDGVWCRIDDAMDIDLDAFRWSHPVFRNCDEQTAIDIWLASIGELGLEGTV